MTEYHQWHNQKSHAAFTRSGQSDAATRYEEFVFKYLFQKAERFTELFNLDEAMRGYFLYHFGPLNMFKLINEDFRIAGLGMCWKYLEGNRTARFVPEEFNRLLVLRWYEINVNGLDLQWDKIQNYNEIRRYFSQLYDRDYRNAMNKIDTAVRHYYLKTGKSIDAAALFRKKKNELFSNDKAYVYRRFVDHCQI